MKNVQGILAMSATQAKSFLTDSFVYLCIQYRKDYSSKIITMKHELLAQSLVKNLTAGFEQRS